MVEKLAIDGGARSISEAPDSYQWVNEETISLVSDLLRSQKLSGFLGQSGSQYLGGEWVQLLEEEVCKFGDHHFAIAFNSWTSGLDAIFLALDLPLYSEVIVPTWTMSATISAIVNAGLTPVFADIDATTFTISILDVRNKISSKSSAICAVDLFGKPADLVSLRELASIHSLKLVTDSAQCPGGRISGVGPSKIADIGGYSLNRHKHIQSGEGGIVVTDNPGYAERLRAIRNHGEVAAPNVTFLDKAIYGHNWRLGEVEALIAYQQYLDADRIIGDRRVVGLRLIGLLKDIEGLQVSDYEEGHDYYILGMVLSDSHNRDFVATALQYEGITNLITNYSGLERLPAFKPFVRGELPSSSYLNDISFLGLYLAGHAYTEKYLTEIASAFRKVFADARAKR